MVVRTFLRYTVCDSCTRAELERCTSSMRLYSYFFITVCDCLSFVLLIAGRVGGAERSAGSPPIERDR